MGCCSSDDKMSAMFDMNIDNDSSSTSVKYSFNGQTMPGSSFFGGDMQMIAITNNYCD